MNTNHHRQSPAQLTSELETSEEITARAGKNASELRDQFKGSSRGGLIGMERGL